MKVILLRDVPNLGRKNEVKDVSDGHARNFLIPQKLVEPATRERIRDHDRRSQAIAQQASKELEHYTKLLARLQSIPLRFTIKVGEKGKPFGSISASDIVKMASKHGLRIEKEWLDLGHGIKATGEQKVGITFPHHVSGELIITIEAA